jgi:hypothetical protein
MIQNLDRVFSLTHQNQNRGLEHHSSTIGSVIFTRDPFSEGMNKRQRFIFVAVHSLSGTCKYETSEVHPWRLVTVCFSPSFFLLETRIFRWFLMYNKVPSRSMKVLGALELADGCVLVGPFV